MDKLDVIIQKLDENTGITQALRHKLEVVDAKLDALTLDVRRVQGETVRINEETNKELNNHEYSIQVLNRRQLQLEAEVEQLKNR